MGQGIVPTMHRLLLEFHPRRRPSPVRHCSIPATPAETPAPPVRELNQHAHQYEYVRVFTLGSRSDSIICIRFPVSAS